jgi:hypothetical protein
VDRPALIGVLSIIVFAIFTVGCRLLQHLDNKRDAERRTRREESSVRLDDDNGPAEIAA